MNHYVYSAMSACEEYKINGKVCDKTLERLIDAEIDLQNHRDMIEDILSDEDIIGTISTGCDDIVDYLQEEDSFYTVIEKLESVIKNVRGSNRDALDDVLDKIKEIESSVVSGNEVIVDEVNKIKLHLKTLNKLGNLL